MKITLLDLEKDGVARVAADGEITISDFADPGKNPLELVLGANWASQRVLFSLERVNFIDSSAIAWMMDTHRTFKNKSGRIVWYAPTARVRDMIDLLKMRRLLAIAEAEAEARAILNTSTDTATGGLKLGVA
jgi:anti-anti-sigma factor